jgi:DNA-binding winged helix-turn-helix (wHTH) protein
MLSEQEQLVFGDFRLDAASRQLHRADGTPVALTPRLYNALYLFASRPGELLDKRELITTLWPGLVVEDNNLSQLISALRRALDDPDGRLIRTEPRRGFRFTPEVHAWRNLPPATPTAAAPHRATLAVLPFVPLSGGERGALLAIGMADTLIARLSTLPQLVVRSLGSVRRFAEGHRDAVLAGRELDVDWVVDGTLQQENARLRARAAAVGRRRHRRLERSLRRRMDRRLRRAGHDRRARIAGPGPAARARAQRHAQCRRLPALPGRPQPHAVDPR